MSLMKRLENLESQKKIKKSDAQGVRAVDAIIAIAVSINPNIMADIDRFRHALDQYEQACKEVSIRELVEIIEEQETFLRMSKALLTKKVKEAEDGLK